MSELARRLKKHETPEALIQKDIIEYLMARGWYVIEMHSSMRLGGIPDLYATHAKHGARWIEVKLPQMKGSRFTKAQKDKFPQINANGTSIWIMTAATHEQYRWLFSKPQGNFLEFYMRKMK